MTIKLCLWLSMGGNVCWAVLQASPHTPASYGGDGRRHRTHNISPPRRSAMGWYTDAISLDSCSVFPCYVSHSCLSRSVLRRTRQWRDVSSQRTELVAFLWIYWQYLVCFLYKKTIQKRIVFFLLFNRLNSGLCTSQHRHITINCQLLSRPKSVYWLLLRIPPLRWKNPYPLQQLSLLRQQLQLDIVPIWTYHQLPRQLPLLKSMSRTPWSNVA